MLARKFPCQLGVISYQSGTVMTCHVTNHPQIPRQTTRNTRSRVSGLMGVTLLQAEVLQGPWTLLSAAEVSSGQRPQFTSAPWESLWGPGFRGSIFPCVSQEHQKVCSTLQAHVKPLTISCLLKQHQSSKPKSRGGKHPGGTAGAREQVHDAVRGRTCSAVCPSLTASALLPHLTRAPWPPPDVRRPAPPVGPYRHLVVLPHLDLLPRILQNL